jgi:hypothetical protein
LSYQIGGKGSGRYYYRAIACHDCGCSEPSNVQYTDVLWEAEPNDEPLPEANGPIVAGLTYYGQLPSDADIHDYYLFELPTDSDVELWLTEIPSGQNYDLVLRDASLVPAIGYSGELGSSAEHIYAELLPAGRYYIQVYHRSAGGSTQPYHLRFVTR